MKLLLLLLAATLALPSFAQKQITPEEAKDHIGETVQITGKVTGIRHLQNAKNTPTFINVGGKYPNQLLTIVIWGNVRKQFTYDLDKKELSTSMVTVTGKLELYKEKPQMVITDPNQIVFKQNGDSNRIP